MTWLQTASGRKFSLTDPDPSQVDFTADVAPALAKIARFCGHTRGSYSVAQHCVVGADALYAAASGDSSPAWQIAAIEGWSPYRLAALFLLHDAHEAYMGDVTTPVVDALDHIRWPDGPPGKGFVAQLVADLKHRLDVAIHQAAGIGLPTEAEAKIIKAWDARMMIAERNALMGKPPEAWDCEVEPVLTTGWMLEEWNSDGASNLWLDVFERYVGHAP